MIGSATTYLFVPAHEERKVGKALASGSDAVILDLEDGVPDAMKGRAREVADRTLRSPVRHGSEVWVRVNDSRSAEFARDVAALPWGHASGAVLPKAEEPAAVQVLAASGVSRMLLLIESVAGFDALPALATAGIVERLAIGTWDLALDLGLLTVDDPDESDLMWHLRCRIVIESRRLGLKPPLDGIYARIDDARGFAEACDRALRLGFGGKLLIHPNQVPAARAAFGTSAAAIKRARDVVAAYEDAVRDGRGAVQVGGCAVDRPMVERARALLARWGNIDG